MSDFISVSVRRDAVRHTMISQHQSLPLSFSVSTINTFTFTSIAHRHSTERNPGLPPRFRTVSNPDTSSISSPHEFQTRAC